MKKISTKHKDKEIEIEKVDTHQFYTGSSYNPGAIHPPCTFKGFHYNHN